MYKHILIPIDGSPNADKAIEAGIEFARARLRPYPDVLARPARRGRALVWKRDPCRAEAFEYPHARVPLTS